MNANKKVKNTLYFERLMGLCNHYKGVGEYAMTISQFCKQTGLKKTHNLRNRLKTLHRWGWYQYVQDYERFGTLEHVIIFNTLQELDLGW